MADSRRNALKQRLQMKVLEQEKKREALYYQIDNILESHFYDNGKTKDLDHISDEEVVKIIQDINIRISGAIQNHKKNNNINADVLIPLTLDNVRSILDPILQLCQERRKGSRIVKHEICLATMRLFYNFTKHFCVNDPENPNVTDIPTSYVMVEFTNNLHLNTALSCLRRNENIEEAKFYLKQYRKLDLIKANIEPDVNRESMIQLANLNYYAGMALYSFQHDRLDDVKNYILKADAALTLARPGGYGFSGALDEVYKTLVVAKLKEKNYPEVLRCHNLRLACSEETIYYYQKIIKDHETKKRIKNEDYIQTTKAFLESELRNKAETQKQIDKLALFLETQSPPEAELNKPPEAELNKKEIAASAAPELKDANDSNEITNVSLKKEKMSKKEKKLQKTLALKKERDLRGDDSAKKAKTIKFNGSYIFSTDAKLSNTFKLRGSKRQYVAITTQLIDQINQQDPSIRDNAMKWIGDICEVGKVLGDSCGMRGFLLNVKDKREKKSKVKRVKVKDASKPWRIWGERFTAVNDDKGNEHTLWELKTFVQKHA